jgi:hypothetical protein
LLKKSDFPLRVTIHKGRGMKVIITFIMLLFSVNSYAYSDCFTHQSCAPDTACQCVVPPDSAFERYYYVDFNDVQKGHIYQCELNDSLQLLIALTDASQFPQGSTYQVIDSLQHFPFTFTLNTQGMHNDTDKMIIKYLAPAGDMPTNLTASCVTVS